MLVAHIFIALGSLMFTTWLFFVPSTAKLRASYALVAATLATGTILAAGSKAHILQTCLSGLLYLAIVATGLVLARQKLAKEKFVNGD